MKEAISTRANLGTAVAVTVDLLTLVLAGMIWRPLSNQFNTLSTINALIIGIAFILFCYAVYMLKRLVPEERTDWVQPHWLSLINLRVLGVIFGVAVAATLAHQFGYFELFLQVDDRVLGAGESSAFFVYAPSAWLGAGLIYMLVLSSTQPPRFELDNLYWQRAALSLAVINGLMVLATAELTAVFTQSATAAAPLTGLILMPLLFLPPRLIYLTRQNSPLALASWTLLLFSLLLLTIL